MTLRCKQLVFNSIILFLRTDWALTLIPVEENKGNYLVWRDTSSETQGQIVGARESLDFLSPPLSAPGSPRMGEIEIVVE